jgi:TIR domain-containing protein
MISIELVPDHLAVDTPTDVLLRLTSTEDNRYFSIVLEVEPRPGLLLEDGDPLILIDELAPDSPKERRLRLRAQRPGNLQLEIVNFSYRDAVFRPNRTRGALLAITADSHSGEEPCESPPAVGHHPARGDHTPTLSTVFVSHRRAESRWFVDLVWDTLRASLKGSRIFVDKRSITGGEKFPARLDLELQRAAALLALIGPQWEAIALTDGTRRITNKDDYVRHEIASALRRQILVVPILYGGAKMPDRTDLPTDLRALADRHAEVVGDRTVNADLRRIAALLRSYGLR